ncbi:MAG TPA: type II toxin-antitoxin system PemK/MazF family toxin [Candidatus Nanoarchaeia archaeon]|nr:type II toxin-antitoxin system PemK/MazF family toxin [Candidatus Nanoarchaeia archaeon]
MNLTQGDILLVPFPFSDQSAKKVRPVVIVSNNKLNLSSQDLIVCAITTNIHNDKYTIKIEKSNLEEKNVIEECCIKAENILKIDKKLIIKKIDKINNILLNITIEKIKTLF